MRAALCALVVLVAAACGTGGSPSAVRGGAADPLTEDVLPFAASTATFTNVRDASARTLRVVPGPDGLSARLVLEAAGVATSEIHVTRREASLWFSADVNLGTELIRLGSVPGTEWESNGRRVRFDGWESVPLTASSIEAARITARRGPAGLEQVETWWFARGVGLVRLKSDRGSISSDELIRASP